MNQYKKWLTHHLAIIMSTIIGIGTINYILDPFWCFGHQHSLNLWQKAPNERQQKANKLYFSPPQYDTLLLGSSRTTFLRQTDFKNLNVFNFSASAMRPDEYLAYIDFAIEDTKQPIENIIIGLDFFGYLTDESYQNINPEEIVNATKSPYYRWKTLVSYDAANNSIRNLRNVLNPSYQNMTYDRNNIHRLFKNNPNKINPIEMQKDVGNYAKNEYAGQPDSNFRHIMNRIKTKHGNRTIIIYTTPVSEPLFRKMITLGHYPHYEKWLKELVTVYGSVYHFMYLHPIAENYSAYFIDSNHAYPETNALIAKIIDSRLDPKSENFGMILTRDNIDYKLQQLRRLNGISR